MTDRTRYSIITVVDMPHIVGRASAKWFLNLLISAWLETGLENTSAQIHVRWDPSDDRLLREHLRHFRLRFF